MCYSGRCSAENAHGECTVRFSPRPCEIEESFTESRHTDMVCPECLDQGVDHIYLYEDDAGDYSCMRCETAWSAPDWMTVYSGLVQRLMRELHETQIDNAALRAELRTGAGAAALRKVHRTVA